MNRNKFEGDMKQFKGKVKEKWGKLTNDDLDVLDGRREQLVGKIQERYGEKEQAASKQVDAFFDGLAKPAAKPAAKTH